MAGVALPDFLTGCEHDSVKVSDQSVPLPGEYWRGRRGIPCEFEGTRLRSSVASPFDCQDVFLAPQAWYSLLP